MSLKVTGPGAPKKVPAIACVLCVPFCVAMLWPVTAWITAFPVSAVSSSKSAALNAGTQPANSNLFAFNFSGVKIAASQPSGSKSNDSRSAEPLTSQDEAAVFQVVRDEVGQLQTALRHKIASLVADKTSESIEGSVYRSTWQVTIKYYLDYGKADDVPFLKGMQRCYADLKGTAGKEWVTWAERQISQRRAEYADQIAFQQQLSMTITVEGETGESGRVDASSIEVFHVLGKTDAVSLSAEILAVPNEQNAERMGYEFLKAGKDGSQSSGKTGTTDAIGQSGPGEQPPEGGSSGGQSPEGQSPGGQEAGGQAGSQSGEPPAAGQSTGGQSPAGQSSGRPSSGEGFGTGKSSPSDSGTMTLIVGISTTALLILVLVIDERVKKNKRRPDS